MRIYVTLVGVFIAALVLTNLIAGRFFTIGSWTLSSGVIAYPVTFLVTDLISEIYGRKRADLAVKVGFVASVFVTIVLLIALQTQIAEDSYVTEESFLNVFGLAPGIVFGSMCAYLAAQFVDVRIYEFWKKLTGGKYLWLRNNGSTILSQLLDTSIVVIVALIIYPSMDGITSTEPITWTLAGELIIAQYGFKALLALIDTPLMYLFTWRISKVIQDDVAAKAK
ncbi:MAG TPA: hypothetical protein DEO99_00315 [Bacteroidetes bacterium]|nr:hypothetical protein [Bacteroidota bacterium]